MRRLARLFASAARGLFGEGVGPVLRGGRSRSARPRLESLENRLTPAVAHTAAGVFDGVAGAFTLANTGTLTFTATGSQTATLVDINVAEFGVDAVAGNAGGPSLWELKTNGNLWQLPGGTTANWIFQDTGTGAISVAPNGVVVDLKTNGKLWRYEPGDPMSGWGAAPLATGVTRADVDASGNVYALVNGNLLKWAPGQTVPVTLNTGASGSGNSAGNVVSFQVGGNTVAWMLGHQDVFAARVEVSYANGTSPSLVTDSNGNGLISVYAVAADGSVVVADPGAATNTGVTLLTIGQWNVDTGGTDVPVNGVSMTGTSFQLSLDGKTLAVLDAAGGNLSAYTIAANALGAEQTLETAGNAQSFGVANDGKVYEFTKAATLQYFDPFAKTPVLIAQAVSANVDQWQVGPNGQVAFLTTAGSFTVGTQTITGVAQIGFAPNGQLYYLTTGGNLFQGIGNPSSPGSFRFTQIDSDCAAFAISSNGVLLDIKKNGRVWRLTGAADKVYGYSPAGAGIDFAGWVLLSVNANTGTATGSQQAGIDKGTSLFILPNGNFFYLDNGALTRLTGNQTTAFAVGQTRILWEANPSTEAGVTVNVPAFNPLLGGGTFFSVLSTEGLNPVSIALF